MGSFDDLCYRLFQFATAEVDADDECCLVLSDRRPARPAIPLTDEKVPVLMLIWYLQREGYRQINKTVIHTLENINAKIVDCRGPFRKKLYLMVICRLAHFLNMTSCIPSDQTQLFYRLLLEGKRIEPYLPLETYVEMSGGKGKIRPLPLPEEGVDVLPLPAPPEVNEDLVVAHAPPLPKKQRRRDKPSEVPLAKAKAVPLPPTGPPGPDPKPEEDPTVESGSGSEDDGPSGSGRPGGSGGGEGGGGAPGTPGSPPVDDDDEDIVVAPRPTATAARVRRPDKPEWRPAIGLGMCRFDPYTTPSGKQAPNYQFLCPHCPKINRCIKTKGVSEENSKRHGEMEALAFLHAWRDTPIVNAAKTHRWHDPPDEEVDAFVEAHRDELIFVGSG